jgi:hypothetical protein
VLLGSAALATLGGVGAFLHLPAAAPGWNVLSEREARLVQAFGEALFPPGNPLGLSGLDVDLPRRVDELLGVELDPEMTPIFRYVIATIDDFTLLSRGGGFARLALEERKDVLAHWDDNDVFPRRALYDFLRLIMGMAFFTLPETTAAVGWRSQCSTGAA